MFPEAFPNLHSIFQQEKQAENQGVNKERKEEAENQGVNKERKCEAFPNLHSIFQQEKQAENQDAKERKEELQGTELTNKERLHENKCKNSEALTEKETQADNKGDKINAGGISYFSLLFTSCISMISGPGSRIGPICLCVCVSQLVLSQPNCLI